MSQVLFCCCTCMNNPQDWGASDKLTLAARNHTLALELTNFLDVLL
jgi:hypothetical protein